MEIKTTKFQELSMSDARSIENYASNIRIYTELDQIFAGIDLHCCSYVTVYKSTDGARRIYGFDQPIRPMRC